MNITNDEYLPLIECKDQIRKYYAIFYDAKYNLNKVEITKNIFLQMFGVHKIVIIKDKKYYYIEYRDEINTCKIELTLKEFKNYNSFKSQNTKFKNIYDRYVEHFSKTEESLQKCLLYKPESVGEIVYRRMLREEIIKAIKTLNDIQRKRFIMYYLEEMTFEEIAIKENCSRQAVKYSIDIAKKNLRDKLKKFHFLT